jgi:hypothetical protein
MCRVERAARRILGEALTITVGGVLAGALCRGFPKRKDDSSRFAPRGFPHDGRVPGLTADFIFVRTRGQTRASQAQSRHKF